MLRFGQATVLLASFQPLKAYQRSRPREPQPQLILTEAEGLYSISHTCFYVLPFSDNIPI